MNLINAMIKAGFLSGSEIDLTNKRNHAIIKEAYYKMIDVLNYVFRTIPTKVDMLINPPEFNEFELDKNLEEEYKRFQNIIKKVAADFNQCSFLFCYLLLTHKKGISVSANFQEELLTMFQSFNRHHPHYQYTPILGSQQSKSDSSENRTSKKIAPKKKPDPRESKLNALHEFYRTTISSADSNIKSFLDKEMFDFCDHSDKFKNESDQEYQQRMLNNNQILMYWNQSFFQSHIKNNQFDDLIIEYKKLYSVYQKIIQNITNKFYNFVLLKDTRFSELDDAEVNLLCYLSKLNSKHSEISLKKNQQKWTLLSSEERVQLATLMKKLDLMTLYKYFAYDVPYIDNYELFYLVDDIKPEDSNLSHYQLNYILKVLGDCPKSTYDENPILYRKLSDTIRKAYGLYLKMESNYNPPVPFKKQIEEILNKLAAD